MGDARPQAASRRWKKRSLISCALLPRPPDSARNLSATSG